MFAKIRHNKSIRDTLYYHEKKEKQQLAQCLTAVNFVKDPEHLTHSDLLYHFHRLTSLHKSITHNGLHISLSFHPSDKLSNDDMVRIADRYMQNIKLDHQPYLVFRHYDTLHPHMHLVTTNIRHDGERLNLSKIDYCHSVQATRALEKEYHLVQSGEWRRHKQAIGQALKVKYGEMPTMTAINNVLEKVIPAWKCTSLEELNAVLRLYNVEAYRGREDSRLYQHKGLVYRVLDEAGRPVGNTIKASLFDSQPTLNRLEEKFKAHESETQRQQHRQRMTTTLEWQLVKKDIQLPALQKTLERQRINMVWTPAVRDQKENIFYVDHETKAVFDGNRLGQRYDAAALRRIPAVLQHHQRHHHTITQSL